MSASITHAKAGGPPDDWHGLRIFDLETGEGVTQVEEVDTAAGWLVRARLNEQGKAFLDGDEIARERLTGRFEIRRPG